MANKREVELAASVSDDYTVLIELSNRCREFHNSRLDKAELTKQKLNIQEKTNDKKQSSLASAMERLCKEMTSLIDQDLTLMSQILTLNEAVEDLKSRRKCFYNKRLTAFSSCDQSDSGWSVSRIDLMESPKDVDLKYPSPSILSMHSCISRLCDNEDLLSSPRNQFANNQRTHKCGDDSLRTDELHKSTESTRRRRRYLETEFSSNDCPVSVYHIDNNSFDSGIDEPLWPLETSV